MPRPAGAPCFLAARLFACSGRKLCLKIGHDWLSTIDLYFLRQRYCSPLPANFCRVWCSMANAESYQSANALIPCWLINDTSAALARMARRPVLLYIDELNVSMRGQVTELSCAHAVVQPESLYYLCKKVYVEIRFRYEDTVYMLAGQAHATGSERAIRFDFDAVARRMMQILGNKLASSGLMDVRELQPAEEAAPQEGEAEKQAAAPAEKKPRPASRVRHEPPPGGMERRKHKRYDTCTPARISLVSEGEEQTADSKTYTSVMIDVSLGGCRLYFEDEDCPLEKNARIEVHILDYGFPLRLPAVVQVREVEKMMGVRFVSLSPRVSERLQALLSDLEAPA